MHVQQEGSFDWFRHHRFEFNASTSDPPSRREKTNGTKSSPRQSSEEELESDGVAKLMTGEDACVGGGGGRMEGAGEVGGWVVRGVRWWTHVVGRPEPGQDQGHDGLLTPWTSWPNVSTD